MVAIINTGYNIRRTFYYNENKVNEGVAECLAAINFPIELEALTEGQRLNMLLKTAEKNQDVKRNSVHISLNFAAEDDLDNTKMNEIAAEYMESIGFGDQPYLVYRHYDAGHPHIHIATVKIRPDGSKIDMQRIGERKSEPARKAIEIKHGLIKAEEHKKQLFAFKPVDATKVIYGKAETKRAIGNVLETVLNRYHYTSLEELNAVLQLYNVRADRGEENSRMNKKGGLVYRVLDTQKQPVGVPIKASLFHNSPTLSYLQKKFLKNIINRKNQSAILQKNIDTVMKLKRPQTFQAFSGALITLGIHPVYRGNNTNDVYGITYVDVRNKIVINGSDIGKNYAADGIGKQILTNRQRAESKTKPHFDSSVKSHEKIKIVQQSSFETKSDSPVDLSINKLIQELFEAENSSEYYPYELMGLKKKRKKKRTN